MGVAVARVGGKMGRGPEKGGDGPGGVQEAGGWRAGWAGL